MNGSVSNSSDDTTPIVPFSNAATFTSNGLTLCPCGTYTQTSWYNGLDGTARCYTCHTAVITGRRRGRTETALRATGYTAPNVVPQEPTSVNEWAELNATIEAVRAAPDRAQSITPAPIAPPVRESFRTWPLWSILMIGAMCLIWWAGVYLIAAKVLGWPL